MKKHLIKDHKGVGSLWTFTCCCIRRKCGTSGNCYGFHKCLLMNRKLCVRSCLYRMWCSINNKELTFLDHIGVIIMNQDPNVRVCSGSIHKVWRQKICMPTFDTKTNGDLIFLWRGCDTLGFSRSWS